MWGPVSTFPLFFLWPSACNDNVNLQRVMFSSLLSTLSVFIYLKDVYPTLSGTCSSFTTASVLFVQTWKLFKWKEGSLKMGGNKGVIYPVKLFLPPHISYVLCSQWQDISWSVIAITQLLAPGPTARQLIFHLYSLKTKVLRHQDLLHVPKEENASASIRKVPSYSEVLHTLLHRLETCMLQGNMSHLSLLCLSDKFHSVYGDKILCI